MHINLLDCARSEAVKRGYNVLYGLLSPVHGSYGKPGLASAPHRLAMARLAVQGSWIEASSWEVDRQCYSASWQVVEWVHQDYVSRGYSGRPVVLFACGADLFEAMTDHRRWPVANVHRLLDRAILAVAKRPGSDVNAVLSAPVFDDRWDRIVFVSEALSDISSSTLRYFISILFFHHALESEEEKL